MQIPRQKKDVTQIVKQICNVCEKVKEYETKILHIFDDGQKSPAFYLDETN